MKYEDKRSEHQKKGQDGRCATVTLKSGAIINAHEYNEAEHGELAKAPSTPVAATSEEQNAAAKKNADNDGSIDFSKKTVPELKDYLADKGVAFDTNARKDDLIALCVEQSKK